MLFCQGTKCHEYRTKDRIRGNKGSKSYQTRRRSSFYYGGNNFCSLNCQNDWFNEYGDRAVDHFGRTTEPKKVLCDQAWYKTYVYNYNNGSSSNYTHYIVNDLLGQRVVITEEQYNDHNYRANDLQNNLSQ
jgi:hypothetical protein